MNAPRPESLRAASTHGSVAISSDVLARLRDHAVDLERPMSSLVDELVRDYLDGTGVWAEVDRHLATINRLGAELELLAQSVRFVVDGLPRFARTYAVHGDDDSAGPTERPSIAGMVGVTIRCAGCGAVLADTAAMQAHHCLPGGAR